MKKLIMTFAALFGIIGLGSARTRCKNLMLVLAVVVAMTGAKAEDTAETVIFINTSDQSVTDPARHWNAVSLRSITQAQQKYTLKDKDAKATTVVAWVLQPSAGITLNALTSGCTGAAAEFSELNKGCGGSEPFSAVEGWDGNSRRPSMRMRLTGLDPAKYYAFTFYGSRKSSSGKIYKTIYSVSGTTSGSATLDNSDNSTKVAKVIDILPNPEGCAEIIVRGAEDSDSLFGFWQGLMVESSSTLQSALQPSLVREFFVDAYGTPAEDANRSWNAVDFTGKNTKKLVDSQGRASDVQLSVTTNLPPALYNTAASLVYTGDAAEFNAARVDTKGLWGCGVTFNGYYAPYIGATVSGLDPAKRYAVTFVGTRNSNDGKNVVGLYSVIGTTTASVTLNAKLNSSKVAAVPAVSPRADGTIDLRISADESNDHPNKFYYLVALKISEYLPEDALRWVSAKATDGGSVAATAGGKEAPTEGWFPNGTTLTATATPDAGWKFVAWTSDWTDAPVTTAAIEIPAKAGATANWTAVFEKDENYTVDAAYFDAYSNPSTDTKTWNQIQTQLFSHNGRLTGVRSSVNAYTPIVITVDQELGSTTAGGVPTNSNASKSLTGDAAPFKAAMTDGLQLFMSMSFSTTINTLQISFVVSGLNPERLYTFKFCASRTGATSGIVYDTLYRALGANEVWTRYDSANNTTKVATLANVRPAADGTVRIESGAGPKNNHANCFTYLGAFSIEGDLALTVPVTARRILWFGNSFSARGNIPQKVEELAVLAGFDRPVIVKDLAEGQNLAYHIGEVTSSPRNNVTADVLYTSGSNGWDDVIIQGFSTEATHVYSPLPDAANGFIANAKTLFDKVTASDRGQNARAILYETWARQPENVDFYPTQFADASAMQQEIASNYDLAKAGIEAVYGRERVETARVGSAFARLGFDKSLYNTDLYHQGTLGQDLIALVIFNRIYNVCVDELVSYEQAKTVGWTSASEADWNRIVRAAKRVTMMGGFNIIIR